MHYVNISDLAPPDWRFLEAACRDPKLSWDVRIGRPANAVERLVTRPALARYRASLSAIRAARKREDSVLVSHLPTQTFTTAGLASRLAPGVPHVAFAFNYTNVPTGCRLALSRKLFRSVREFVVFSRYEVGLYADLFNIPAERFVFLPWTMEAPEFDVDATLPFDEPYLCAIGGEGRDYDVLARAMAHLPQARLAIIARPHSVAGLTFPDNVRVFTNLPAPLTWAIAKGSAGLAVSLLSDATPNGHVTIVGAQRLGVPLVVTRSAGVADYVDAETATLVEAGDAEEMAAALQELLDAPDAAALRAERARMRALQQSDLSQWLGYFSDLDARLRA